MTESGPPADSVMAPRGGRRHATDVVFTALFFSVLAGAALIAVVASGFFAMATDSCLDRCDTSGLTIAYVVLYGGVALGIVGAVVGTLLAASRGRLLFLWPLLGVVVIGVAFAVAGSIAGTVGH